jgi:hypothetical protein
MADLFMLERSSLYEDTFTNLFLLIPGCRMGRFTLILIERAVFYMLGDVARLGLY